MSVELKVPEVGESITEVQIGNWLKQPGEFIHRDEPVVEIETDKATVELPAPVGGVITEVRKQSGEPATVGEVVGLMEEQEAPKEPQPTPTATEPEEAPEPKRAEAAALTVMPAAKRVMAEQQVRPEDVEASGPGGRVLKEDVVRHVAQRRAEAPTAAAPPAGDRTERVVRMSPMRKTIAARLVNAQQTAALLTTFNEIDMHEVKQLRAQLQEDFQDRFGIKLGFMSFFIKAAVEALKEFPNINAEIRGDEIVYHNFYDVGIAVSSAKGLVVPVLRDVDRMTLATIERRIADFGARAKENKIAIAELEGGTFTISNGGVFGSLLSTPIVNPPQSGVLGMHAIQDRPVARDGEVVIRPMMYVALTYDHRIVDGREAVRFLRTIKELIEEPARLLLEG